MKTKALLFLCSLFLSVSARAQWKSETYALKGGWNAIYLHGDARQDTIDNLFPNSGVTANVQEIWRWNPNPNAVQFTASPLIPSAGTPEWSVWKRGGGAANTFSLMTGQTAYLVKCVGTTANSYSIPLVQSPLMPNSVWVRNGEPAGLPWQTHRHLSDVRQLLRQLPRRNLGEREDIQIRGR